LKTVENIVSLFDSNIEAVYTNRGFYYQYLAVVKKWISNYISNENTSVFVEVENDIKEVGNKIVFTQVKCYSSTFSFQSEEVMKSIFDFFMLFLKNDIIDQDVKFCFLTNTQVSPREKLLKAWINDKNLLDSTLKINCSKKIKEILISEINKRKKKKLSKKLTEENKVSIKLASEDFKKRLASEDFIKFVESIIWDFAEKKPVEAIEEIFTEIQSLLKSEVFQNISESLVLNVLLSEVYRCSQNVGRENRELSKNKLTELLLKTDQELQECVNHKFTQFLGIEIQILKSEIQQIKLTQDLHSNEIETLKITKTPVTYPKDLTLLPDIMYQNFVGNDDILNQLHFIITEKNSVAIHGIGGVGKTTLAKRYLKKFDNYDHTIWITVEESLLTAFNLNDVLISNLGLTFTSTDTTQKRFEIILNTLNQIDGNNLIVIDFQDTDVDLSLATSLKWKMLVISRYHTNKIPTFKFPQLSFDEAKEIFFIHNFKDQPTEDSTLKVLFDYVHYNALVIELTAKTISNSFDLSLDTFLSKLLEQNLNTSELEIDINLSENDTSIRIFTFLMKTFEMNNLTSAESAYLEFLSLLPSNDIVIKDLIDICGQDDFAANKVMIINWINSLEKKGWLETDSTKTKVQIHKIIQDIVIYKERESNSPFISNIFYLTWLSARLKEGYNDPSKSFKYLKYVVSILHSIKEAYRSALYQHLIILENELLYCYRFYFNQNETTKWLNLLQRAEKGFAPNDPNIAVISNNLGLSYIDSGDLQNAINYFKKSIEILKLDELKYFDILITTLNNLSQIYIDAGDMVNSLNCFKEIQKLRKKYSRYDDQQLSIECNVLAKSYYLAGETDKGVYFLKEAIRLHKELAYNNRNDFNLASYYDQLSLFVLSDDNFKEAERYQKVAINLLNSMNLQSSEHILFMYKKLLKLYEYTQNIKKADFIKMKIKNFKADKIKVVSEP